MFKIGSIDFGDVPEAPAIDECPRLNVPEPLRIACGSARS
jgi:hypothetical protein